MKKLMVMAAAAATVAAWAQQPGGREAFLGQQTATAVQQLSGQLDVMQTNHDELVARVAKIESQRREIDALKGEIAALKGVIQQLHKEIESQRADIVEDLTQRIKKMQAAMTPPSVPTSAVRSAAPAPRPTYGGPLLAYQVESGDTLSRIAAAFKTTVGRIREINGLKSDTLRIGQTINVPQPKE